MKRIFSPVIFIFAVAYFAVDAAFSYVAKPLADWLGRLRPFSSIRAWIVSLNRYSALALFAVPVLVLEPVKPVAAYFMATGHLAFGLGSRREQRLCFAILSRAQLHEARRRDLHGEKNRRRSGFAPAAQNAKTP